MDYSPQAPLSMTLSRREYWSGLPCPPPGDLPDLGTESTSLRSPCVELFEAISWYLSPHLGSFQPFFPIYFLPIISLLSFQDFSVMYVKLFAGLWDFTHFSPIFSSLFLKSVYFLLIHIQIHGLSYHLQSPVKLIRNFFFIVVTFLFNSRISVWFAVTVSICH